MGRRRRGNTTRYYCPKCGRKTLVEEQSWQRDVGSWFTQFRCTNQPPKNHAKLWEEMQEAEVVEDIDKYAYWGYDARHDQTEVGEKLRAEQRAKAAASFKSPPCDCVISKPGANATINDFHTVLDLLVRDGHAIEHWLFENNSGIHRRGFEVLHSDDVCDVVRLRDDQGVNIWLYWKAAWEPDYDGPAIERRVLTHTAAGYLSFRGVPLPTLFRNGTRLLLWTKSPSSSSRDAVFSGSLTQKKRSSVVEWAKTLVRDLPQITDEAAEAVSVWDAWGKQLKSEISAVTNKLHVSGFDQRHEKAAVQIQGWLPPEKIKAIAAILADVPSKVDAGE